MLPINAADAGSIPEMTKKKKKGRILKLVINGIHGKNVLSSLPVGKGFLFVLLYYYFFLFLLNTGDFCSETQEVFFFSHFWDMSELAKVEDKYFRTLQ